jgi:hypothetical protein
MAKPSPKCRSCRGHGRVCLNCNGPLSVCPCPSNQTSPAECECVRKPKRKSRAGSRHGRVKGNGYENDFCKELSLWYSCGWSKDWFEPLRSSGGKASRAAKKGEKVSSTGDVISTNKQGCELLERIKIEVKRGYNKEIRFPGDLFKTSGLLWTFIDQAKRAAIDACGSSDRYWFVIRPDHAPAYLMMDESLARRIHSNPLAPPGFLIVRNTMHGTHRVYLLSEFFAEHTILQGVSAIARM